MDVNAFPEEAMEALKCYVYRLVDPRNGETFYVGRGRKQRVFEHIKGAVDDSGYMPNDLKLERIHEIHALGMNVQHIIHRHGMSESVAKEVEGALIDAYPGLTNKIAGDGRDRGTMHANEIALEYSAEEFIVGEPLILISIGQLWKERGIYEAVRGVWGMNMKRAKEHKLVLAHVRGVVRGAYRPEKWLKGTAENFPLDEGKYPGRIGFEGKEAEDVWDKYVGKRVPKEYRKRGAQSSFRYLPPS